MKKPIILLIAITFAVFMLTSCGGGSNADVPATAEAGVLKVAIVDGNDRFSRNASGAPSGIEADIAKLVADNGGYALRLSVASSEDAMISGIANGEFDLGFGRIANTDSRISGLTVSSGYGKGGLFLVTPKYNYMDCLTIMQAGTLGISSQAEPLRDEVKGAEEIMTAGYDDMALLGSDIASGTVLAGLVSERQAMGMLSDSVQAQELIDSPKETYVAVMPKGSPLVDTVNGAISQYKVDNASGKNE